MLRTHRLVLPLLLAAASLGAQAADFKFGVQGTLALPTEDLKTLTDSGKGVGLGLFVDVLPEGSQFTLRPRLDYLRYPKRSWYGSNGSLEETRRISLASLGADCLYHINPNRQGLYLAVGVNATQLRSELDGDSFNTSRLGYSAGLGWSFGERWEVNLRYGRSTFESVNLGSLQLGAAVRF